jgi:hypothetical protein
MEVFRYTGYYISFFLVKQSAFLASHELGQWRLKPDDDGQALGMDFA